MADYGLTPKGPNIKRLDVIIDQMHTSLSEKWGVNTKQNPESFLNHIITNIADAISELWEFGEDIYYSQYPASAEGISLDNAAQYGGLTRETASRSNYPIHCTGRDGTVLVAGTMISSNTNPTNFLTLSDEKIISRNSFNSAKIKIASHNKNEVYTVAINGAVFSYSSNSESVSDVLEGLANAITDEDFSVTVIHDEEILSIEAIDTTSTNALVLSENLTTDTVTSIIMFGTVETGNILIPDRVITNIVKADAGLLSVINRNGYVAGRDEEKDSELRQSYADKIFNRSSMMLESIRSAILNNVQGVTSVAPYENDTNETDESGRPPHSIEIVVDGGDSAEIARQILNKKAGGIQTYGDTSVVITGEYDEDITINFSRPTTVYTWFRLGITLSKTQILPSNYVEILRSIVLENMEALDAGKDVVPVDFVSAMKKACPGITYIDTKVFGTTNSEESPVEYHDRSLSITARQRAYTAEQMIEVVIDD